MDQKDLQSTDIQDIIDAHQGHIHDHDVGALFGQLTVLARELRHDVATRKRYAEVVSAALALDACHQDAPAVIWTRLVARTPRRQRRTTEELASQYS